MAITVFLVTFTIKLVSILISHQILIRLKAYFKARVEETKDSNSTDGLMENCVDIAEVYLQGCTVTILAQVMFNPIRKAGVILPMSHEVNGASNTAPDERCEGKSNALVGGENNEEESDDLEVAMTLFMDKHLEENMAFVQAAVVHIVFAVFKGIALYRLQASNTST